MSSIITRVVLPGLGAVCPEYLSRGNLPALPPASRSLFIRGHRTPNGLRRERV